MFRGLINILCPRRHIDEEETRVRNLRVRNLERTVDESQRSIVDIEENIEDLKTSLSSKLKSLAQQKKLLKQEITKKRTVDAKRARQLQVEEDRALLVEIRDLRLPFPIITYKSDSRLHDDSECAICLHSYKNKDKIATIDCFHMYHLLCLYRWLRYQSKETEEIDDFTCPKCRLKINL